MITPNGGVFGRNPKFNTVTTQGGVTVGTTATVAGDVTLTNGNIVVASGKGIDFSATAGTGTSELFADYEEGTWTPTYAPVSGSFTALTMDVVDARYTKVGRQVTVTAFIRTDNLDTTGGSSSVRINGLPFSVPALGFTAGAVAYAAGWTTHPFAVYATSATTALTITTRATADGIINDAVVADLNNSASADQNQLIFTCTYFV